jgi:EAL domain-containing protein (putative c-di-GMP-specific phosphodiesterase class I)
MYRAKDAGKARYEIFDTGMHARAIERLHLETDLRTALEQTSGFHLLFQPLINLASGRMYGVEALVRWRHPKRGLVSPDEFIPLAEETGFIISLGWWILERAFSQVQSWETRFPGHKLTMSINISVIQLRRPDFVTVVKEMLGRYNLRQGSVIFEITESQLMTDAASLVGRLNSLKELGIKIHVDDFGTGYSSLAYLHRFPIDVLKIDRSFISAMATGEGASEIVPAVVMLGHNMKMTVIAEGIETGDQKTMLQELGCDLGQGYHFSRPVEAGVITEFLEQNKIW